MPITDIKPTRIEWLKAVSAEHDRLVNQANAIQEKLAELRNILTNSVEDIATLEGVDHLTHEVDLVKGQFVPKA